ncbi:FtsX-like permease family protein [Agromyces sp. G08B096]|uniref:FtsX-like permease family protein n=1 Tax=Agromyces sp. G08B096 TaxID=3156399 RepID=A0AAU7WB82_9MICO
MGTARTTFARAWMRGGVFAGIAATVFVAAGLGGGLADLLTAAPATGVAQGVGAARGEAGAVRWQTGLDRDAEAQADAAAGVLDRMLVPRGAVWSRSVASEPVPATADGDPLAADGEPASVVLIADPEASRRARLVAGDWADSPASRAAADAAGSSAAAVQATAAAELGLEPGDVVAVGDDGARLLVTGTWEPVDPGDPTWFGDALVAAGVTDDAFGPMLVDEAVLAELPAAVRVRWTATVGPAPSAERLGELARIIPTVEPALRDEPEIGETGLTTSGRLGDTAGRLVAADTAVRAIAPLALAVVAVGGLTAIWRLASLLDEARRRETVLLRARGASPARLAWTTALEVLVVSAPSAALGVVVAEALLGAARGGEPRQAAIAWATGAVVAAAAIAIVAGIAWVGAHRPIVRGAGDDSGRAPRLAAAGGTLLVAVLAAVALSQFLLHGGPLVGGRTDPFAVLAPVLVLVALSLIALLGAGPAGRILERTAGPQRGLTPALPVRQLARRPSLYASAALVTIVAIAGLTLAASFAGAWQGFDDRVAASREGGQVRVELAGRGGAAAADPLAIDDPFRVDGVTSSAPALTAEVRIGSDAATLVAVPASELATVAPGTAAALDPRVASLAEGPGGRPVPRGAELAAHVDIAAPAGTPGTVSARAWLLGPQGAATTVPLGTIPVGAGADLAADLPDVDGLELIGLELRLTGSQGLGDPVATVTEVTAAGEPVELAGDVSLSAKEPSARLAVPETEGTVPVLLSARLAAAIDAGRGDPMTFRVVAGGVELDGTVVGDLPALPGSGDLLADLGALQSAAFAEGGAVPRYDERWLAASDPAAVALALERAQPVPLTASTRSTGSAAAVVAPAAWGLWTAAGGALAFALVTLAALASALGAARLSEEAVLRAVGVPARLQARARFAELAWQLTASIVVGIAVGLVTAVLTVPGLVRAAVPGAPAALATEAGLAAAPWALAIAAFAALALAVAWFTAAAVGRRAARAIARGDDA